MILRTEESSDYSSVYALTCEAFGGRNDESLLIERIRASVYFVPELSIVAEIDNKIVGHLLLSRATVVEQERNHDVMVLAPVAVKPEYQKRGIGGSLIREGLHRCRTLGYGLVLLIGHPDYYPKFGFKPARSFQFELRQFEVPNEVFMVCELQEGEIKKCKGELRYPEAFLS
jgi:putative acetyltransferase